MSADEPCGYKYGVIDIQILSHGCQPETWWCRCRCAEGTPYVGRVHACVRACVSTGSQPASLRMCGSKIDLLTQGQTPRGEERHGHDDNGDISDSLMLQFSNVKKYSLSNSERQTALSFCFTLQAIQRSSIKSACQMEQEQRMHPALMLRYYLSL